MNRSPCLEVLVVGCGNIGGAFDQARSLDSWPLTHAGAYARHGGFRITGCADPDIGRREAFRHHWQVPHAFESCMQAVTAGFHWDVVSICSPTQNHLADVTAALRVRPHLIFCEKPLAPTWAEAVELVQACATAGVSLAVNHTRRWAPDIQAFGRQLAAGSYGTVRSVCGRYNKGILNNGSHLLDLLRFWLGPLELVTAGHAVPDFWVDDPTIPALLTASNQTGISLVGAHAADYAIFEVELITSKAVIAMEDGGLAWRERQPGPSAQFVGYRTLETGLRRPGRYMEAMTCAADNIYHTVVNEAPLMSTGETALQAQSLCEAIRRAVPSTLP